LLRTRPGEGLTIKTSSKSTTYPKEKRMKKLLFGTAIAAFTLAPLAALAPSAHAEKVWEISACNERNITQVRVQNHGPEDLGTFVTEKSDDPLATRSLDHGTSIQSFEKDVEPGRTVVLVVDHREVAEAEVATCG
jgi:hypothetical protein